MGEEGEEVGMEVEAVQAVYGDDCLLIDSYPPRLHLHIKPRTADISSQQFVEAVIGIKAGSKYPKEPPIISLIDSKGLDDQRQQHLISSIEEKAAELSSCLMLLQLCEEAIERLTVMNHPDGDCPLCLHPLVPEDGQIRALPFMKLMSCFHCFHGECIIRWWNWLQTEKETSVNNASTTTAQPPGDTENREGMNGSAEESLGNCPVCRKLFQAKDFEHVLDLVGAHSSLLESDATEGNHNEELLQSDSESRRRERFEAILKLQRDKGGLVEPKRNIAVVPGMFLQQPVASPAPPKATEESAEQQEQEKESAALVSTISSGSSNSAGSSRHHNSNVRKQRERGPRRAAKQWVQKR